MAYRAIQDNVAASESLAGLTDFAERLYWRLLSRTDSCGRLPGSSTKVRALCMPLVDHATAERVDKALEDLVRAGRINLYFVRGTRYCQLVDFDEHQPQGLIGKARQSRFPAPAAGEVRADSGQETETETRPEEPIGAASPAPTRKRGRRRDPEFEALLEVCGIDAASITETGRGAINRALRDIRNVGATPEEIRARAAEYRGRFNVPLTATALAKHWGSLGEQAAALVPATRSRQMRYGRGMTTRQILDAARGLE